MSTFVLDSTALADDNRYGYFESGRDTGVVGYGHTLEQSFEHVAEAMFALTADLSQVHPVRTLPVSFIEASESRALLRWLNLVIELARRHRLALCEFHVQHEHFRWWGCASGQPLAQLRPQAVAVRRAKADTLSVKQGPGGWEARCIVECTGRDHARPRP